MEVEEEVLQSPPTAEGIAIEIVRRPPRTKILIRKVERRMVGG